MSSYRRATLQDLAKLGYVPNTQKYKEHIEFARKYYPPEATTMVMTIHSEYNDCTYDNSFQYVIVYDKDGNELPPLKKTAKEKKADVYSARHARLQVKSQPKPKSK
jgi:hypothetical protein